MRRHFRRGRRITSITTIMAIFIAIICSISVGYSLLSEELSITGKGNLIVPESADGKFSISYVLNNRWYSQGRYFYDYTIIVENLTETDVNGWTIVLNVPNDAADISGWNSTSQLETNKIIFTNVDYNSIISSHLTVNFGFQISTADADLTLSKGTINGLRFEIITENNEEEPTTPEVEPISVTLTNVSGWGDQSGYIKQITYTLENKSDSDIISWKFDLVVPNETSVYASWSMAYIQKENVITFSNVEWNKNIPAKGKTEVSVQLKSKTQNYTPEVTNIITSHTNQKAKVVNGKSKS